MDIGDIVGVTGPMKRTDKGELSIVAEDLQVSALCSSYLSSVLASIGVNFAMTRAKCNNACVK